MRGKQNIRQKIWSWTITKQNYIKHDWEHKIKKHAGENIRNVNKLTKSRKHETIYE